MTVTKESVQEEGYIRARETCVQEIEIIVGSGHLDDPERLLEDELDLYTSEFYGACSADTYQDAIDIVLDNAFAPSDEVDFTDCATALDCVMREANMSIEEHVRTGWNRFKDEAVEIIKEMWEIAQNRGVNEIKVSFEYNSIYGHTPCNRINDSGIVIYDDKPGGYNPKLLDGSLIALEYNLNGAYISTCWQVTEEDRENEE